MGKAARLAIAALLVVIALSGPAGKTHTGWGVEGSFQASPRFGCGVSPTCLAYSLRSGQLNLGCPSDLDLAHGAEISIVPLPEGTAGHRAKISWNAAVGPVNFLAVGWLAPPQTGSGCIDTGQPVLIGNENFPPLGAGERILTVEPRAKLVWVNGEAAFGVTWKLEGVED